MKNRQTFLIVIFVLMMISTIGAYEFGKFSNVLKYDQEKEYLYELNRSELENLQLIDGQVYVIGHKSPDSDTVCSAIAYARLLNELGIEAEAAITEKINNESAFILFTAGVEVPEILYDASGLNIVMVDHSEYLQAVDNLIDANIVGIIDHHGVGSVSTGHQLLYNAKPIGSTATIIWMEYLKYGIEMDEKTAEILLGAVLSDTDNLTGSTVIEADRRAVQALNEIARINLDEYYNALHAQKLSYEGFTDEEIIYSDFKEYESNGFKYGIGAINVLSEEEARNMASRLKPALSEAFDKEDLDMMYLSIRQEDGKIDYIVPADEFSQNLFRNAFPDYDEYDGISFVFKASLGRKTKFVPGMNDYLTAHPHE